jgi:predicted Ser/Thr protein kinase
VDQETGEITDPDDAQLRQIEQQGASGDTGGFQPSAEEIAAIHAREMAEAQQSAPASRQRRERGHGSLHLE